MKILMKGVPFFLCLFLFYYCVGCASTRYISSKKPTEFHLSKSDIKYNIVKSKFEYDGSWENPNGQLNNPYFNHCCLRREIQFVWDSDNCPEYFLGGPRIDCLTKYVLDKHLLVLNSEEYVADATYKMQQKFGEDKAYITFFHRVCHECILDPNSLMDKAIELYPDIFSRDSSSLPIEVSGNIISSNDNYLTLFLEVITVGILGGIFPLPFSEYFDIALNIKSEKAISGDNITASDTFKVENHGWITFLTPFGIIPIPGPADIPKTFAMTLPGVGESLENGAREITQRAIIYSIVDNIIKNKGNNGSHAIENQ